MEITTAITNKNLTFINDPILRKSLQKRLDEMDRIFFVNANYSIIFLAMSIIEGIFKHIAEIFEDEIKRDSSYPIDKGKPKTIDNVPADILYALLKDKCRLSNIENFDKVYKLFRGYRNFIHPQKENEKVWMIDIGQAQMALGLLNATIEQFSKYIFIGKEIWKIIEGKPDYDSDQGVLQLPFLRTHVNSFLILDRKVSGSFLLDFELELLPNSVFNFVFNFHDEGSFNMIRLDNRPDKKIHPNCILYCKQKNLWDIALLAEPSAPPEESFMKVSIKIDFQQKDFSFSINGSKYIFRERTGNIRNLIEKINENLKVGFFNEVSTVRLLNMSFQ